MTLEVQVFDNLKVKEENGQVLFDAETAAIGLGLTQVKSHKTYVQWKRVNNYLNNLSAHVRNSNSQEVAKGDFITEPQFYKLAIKANNETAEKFQDWVTSEVLPAIRKHGSYMTNEKAEALINRPNDTLADLLIQAGEQLKVKDVQISEMKPKALFADAVSASQTSILVGELAKLLKQNGVEIGANRLFVWLRENGYLIKRKGTDYNMPTQRSMELGLFEIKEHSHINSNGVNVTTKTPKVTGKGQQYFINKFLSH